MNPFWQLIIFIDSDSEISFIVNSVLIFSARPEVVGKWNNSLQVDCPGLQLACTAKYVISSPFAHSEQVCTQVQLSITCDNLCPQLARRCASVACYDFLTVIN